MTRIQCQVILLHETLLIAVTSLPNSRLHFGMVKLIQAFHSCAPYFLFLLLGKKINVIFCGICFIHHSKKEVSVSCFIAFTLFISMCLQSVFDHDTFTLDDSMGDAEFDVKPFVEAVRMPFEGIPDGTIIRKIEPNRQNCLSEESRIIWYDGKVVQNITLRLRNVECGEVELQLQWINLPSSKAF